MDVSRYAALFLAESREHLSSCNQFLLEWERDPAATEPVDGLFRAIHTIKGMAATMGYSAVTELAHRTENLLDALRSGRLTVEPEFLQLLFRSVDAITAAVERAAIGDHAPARGDAGLLVALDDAASRHAPGHTAEFVAAVAVARARLVRVTIRPDAAMRGGRAMLALRRAEAVGTVSDVRPAPAMFEREDFSGAFSFRIAAETSEEAVARAVRSAGEVLHIEFGDAPATGVAESVASRGRQIRVDLRRLDALMKQVGELVVARNRLVDLATTSAEPALPPVAERIGRLVSDMQSEIMQARMSPVGEVFERYPRLVRDLGRELGKQARFESEGDEIELDRAVLDEIGDPLLHLVRNAVDHGLETAAARLEVGKPAEGRIRVTASRERNSVAIRVSDDGRGVDREKIRARGIRDGILPADTARLTDDLLLRVLARPGFSTAERVSGVSGRGVGVDVAATRVRALGGTLSVTSEEGKGTTFTVRVPLTLAIVRALLTGVGSERYAVPLAFVAETVEFDGRAVTAVRDREALIVRDRAIPTVHLRQLVSLDGEVPARRPSVILEVGDRRAALVVDRLLGQQDIVIEPFEGPRGMPSFVGGATILADGAPALILDAAALV
ncbi:MAG TPA: chemotaxis protein CheA [Gemmatimonadales bacterium]|nr:chemotaxis protein CheA [Gemmatimonadales bacterium]